MKRLAALLGALAATVSLLGSWIPSFWGDEAASVMSAERPWPSLFRMFGHVDAVHGAYYTFLHGWVDLFGASEFSVRLPSALAIGAATAGLVILANHLAGRSTAIVAGLVFLILPSMTDMGSEARSYAFSAACAIWLSVLLLRLIATGDTRVLPWLGYGALFAVSMYVFLYLALMALVHAAILFAAGVRPGALRGPGAARRRALLTRWISAIGVGVLLAAPVLVYGIAQRDQISWIGRRPPVTLEVFFVDQWFRTGWLALAGWALIVAFAAASAWAAVSRRNRLGLSGARLADAGLADAGAPDAGLADAALADVDAPRVPSLATVASFWLVIPTGALILGDLLIGPIYTIRYTSFVAPAVALLMAAAIDLFSRWSAALVGKLRASIPRASISRASILLASIPRASIPRARNTPVGDGRRVGPVAAVALIAILAALAAPTYLAQRAPYAKDEGSDWAQLAVTIEHNAHAGDAIIFGPGTRPSRDPRLAMHVYPSAFRGLVDVTLAVPYTEGSWLGDKTRSISASAGALDATDGRVWLVRYVGPTATSGATQLGELQQLGYRLQKSIPLHRDTIYLLVRGGAR